MRREKNANPMFISTTNGIYNFIDFATQETTQSKQAPQEVEPSIESQKTPSDFIVPTESTFQKDFSRDAEQPTLHSTPKPLIESMMASNASSYSYNYQPFQKADHELIHTQNTDSVTYLGSQPASNFYSLNQSSPSMAVNTSNTSAGEFTEDKLLELLIEPHRSNILAMKSKGKNAQRFGGY